MSPLTMELSATQARRLEERWAKMRSHKRAVASQRFLVEWEEGEQRRCANGITVDVSDSGCMAVVGADLPLRRQVRLVLPGTGRSAQGEVVWRGHEAWDIGIALAEPDASFWGVKI
jgi:PilZ domain